MNTPFRYDFVGSFLRPLSLKEARKQFEAGTISKQELVKVEDACIEDLIAKQKTAGYHVITDGEFRRATWHLDFFWEFNGVVKKKLKTNTLTTEVRIPHSRLVVITAVTSTPNM